MAACGAWLDFACRPEYRQIALVDAPAVVGAETWHRIDAAVGLRSMEFGLAALHAERPLAVEPTPALAVMLFGALTEAGISLSHAATPSRQDLLQAMRTLIDALTT
jgi:hypothetical protein